LKSGIRLHWIILAHLRIRDTAKPGTDHSVPGRHSIPQKPANIEAAWTERSVPAFARPENS
jgi:hypothetical protein